MLVAILPDPPAVSISHQQRGVSRIMYSRTHRHLAPERAPDPTRTLPPISELIASLSLSEPPSTTGTASSSGHRSFSPLSATPGSLPPPLATTALPSIGELNLPDPFAAHRSPRRITVQVSPPVVSPPVLSPPVFSRPQSEESPRPKIVGTSSRALPSPASSSRTSPQDSKRNAATTKRRSAPSLPAPTTQPQSFDPKAGRMVDSVPVAKPRRIQGQRTDLILAKRKKPAPEPETSTTAAESPSGAKEVVEESHDIPLEGKGWSDDGQDCSAQRSTLAIREKKPTAKKKRRASSDPYQLTFIKLEEADAQEAEEPVAAKAQKEEKQQGKRRDLRGWKE